MNYKVTFSTEDGDRTKEFSSLPLAEEYMNEVIKGLERWTSSTFYPYDSPNHIRLFKDRKNRCVKIDRIQEG
jgi:hypothetical protein